MAIRTGLRREGLFNLTFSDITEQKINGKTYNFLSVREKGGKQRMVPLSGPVMEIINRRKDESDSERVFDLDYIGSISQMFKRAIRAYELSDNLRIHSLRHTFAVNYLKNGVI